MAPTSCKLMQGNAVTAEAQSRNLRQKLCCWCITSNMPAATDAACSMQH